MNTRFAEGGRRPASYGIPSVFPTLVVLTMAVPQFAFAQQPIYAARPKIGGVSGVIYRLFDANNDGDALDANERRTYRNDAGQGPVTDDFNGVAVSRSGNIYVIERHKGRVIRLRDLNADDDAQDAGEATIYRNNSDAGLQLQLPHSIAASQTYDPDSGKIIDVVYVIDAGLQAVIRLQDLDGDGDAGNNDEACMLHHSTSESGPISALQVVTTESGELIATNHNMRTVVGLIDLTGDCHTEGGRRDTQCPPQNVFNEYRLIRSNAPAGPDMNEPFGIGVDSEDIMFVSDANPPVGTESAKVIRLEDLNSDYNALGGTEGSVYKSGACAQGVAFRTPGAVAVDDKALVYVGDLLEGIVVMLVDANADKDANDANECRLFADGMSSVVSLAVQLHPLPPPEMVFVSGVVDLGKEKDLYLPDANPREFKLMLFNDDDGSRLPDAKIRCDSPTGCLECSPLVDRTDADGLVSFLVTRLGPPDDETLIVSTLGAHEIINVPAIIPEEDNDYDDIPNSQDNCENKFNPGQEDDDGDGIGDECDPCPHYLDADNDNFVNRDDFEKWADCLDGPGAALTSGCVCTDADGDGDSDIDDYGVFQNLVNSP